MWPFKKGSNIASASNQLHNRFEGFMEDISKYHAKVYGRSLIQKKRKMTLDELAGNILSSTKTVTKHFLDNEDLKGLGFKKVDNAKAEEMFMFHIFVAMKGIEYCLASPSLKFMPTL